MPAIVVPLGDTCYWFWTGALIAKLPKSTAESCLSFETLRKRRAGVTLMVKMREDVGCQVALRASGKAAIAASKEGWARPQK